MNIETVKDVQRKAGLLGTHLVYLEPHGEEGMFWLAHTDAERDKASMVPLTACPLHTWMAGEDAGDIMELDEGYYIVTPHIPDTRSESLGAGPWDFEPINPCAACEWAGTCGDPPGSDCHS